MKNTNWLIITFLLSANIYFIACQKETPNKGLYAPDGQLLSNSLEELTDLIANTIQVPSKEMEVVQLNYLNVPTGYVAEMKVAFKSANITKTIYYISEKARPAVTFEGTLLELPPKLQVADRYVLPVGDAVAWCTCGTITGPVSEECDAIVSIDPKTGAASGKCQKTCTNGCFAHVSTGN